ncbi:C25 family cysteine peptidase, partial [Planctomycetota bacterium]|nr:C25 family cysteine peptidase [Planctomycetota bacterium]
MSRQASTLAAAVLALAFAPDLLAQPSVDPQADTWITDNSVTAVAHGTGPTKGITYIGGGFRYVGPNTGRAVPIVRATATRVTPFALADGTVNIAIPDGGGGWYIGGVFRQVGGVGRNRVAHILADGSLDLAFDADSGGTVQALLLDAANNTLYIGGQFTSMNGGTLINRLCQVNAATGALNGAWNPNCNSTVFDLAMDATSTFLYAGGAFQTVGGNPIGRVAQITVATGVVVPAWNPHCSAQVNAIALDATGTNLYVGGTFTTVGLGPVNPIPRLAQIVVATGLSNPGWVPNVTTNGVNDVVLDPAGTFLYAGGNFANVGGNPLSGLAQISIPTGLSNAGWNPSPDSTVNELAITASGTTLYVGGAFSDVGGKTLGRIAEVDVATGMANSAWNPNASGTVNTVRLDPTDTFVFAGGAFVSVNGKNRNRLAAIDHLTGEATDWNPDAGSTVNALAISPDGRTVYAGGAFVTMSGSTRNRLAAIDASRDGSLLAWDPDAGASVNALALSPDGSFVYAAGAFTTIGGTTRNRLARITTDSVGTLTGWDPNANTNVKALAVSADGTTIFAGGQFATVGGVSHVGVCKLDDADTVTVSAWDPAIASGIVNSLSLTSDGTTLYMGGSFTSINVSVRQRLAAVDTGTAALSSWNPNASSTVNAVRVNGANSIVYVGGAFTTLNGGTARNRLAALDTVNGTLLGWDPNMANSVNTLELRADDQILYAGGTFQEVGATPLVRPRFAEFRTTSQIPTLATNAPEPSRASVNRTSADAVEITFDFFDSDDQTVDSYTVTLEVRDTVPTSRLLLSAATNGGAGLNGAGALTITKLTTGCYRGSVVWDPPVGHTLGVYDLGVSVTDLNGTDTNGFASDDNTDELTLINEPITGTPFDNALFNDATPVLRFVDITPTGNRSWYEVQWDTDSAFGSATNRRSDLGIGFQNTATPAEVSPLLAGFTTGQEIDFTMTAGDIVDGQTIYWRVRHVDVITMTAGNWSTRKSFSYDSAVAPATPTHFAFFQRQGAQFDTNTLTNVDTSGGRIAIATQTPAGKCATAITPVVQLVDLDSTNGNQLALWSKVMVTGDHPNDATAVTVEVVDADMNPLSPVARMSSGPVANGAFTITIDLTAYNTAGLRVVITAWSGSTPTINDIILLGDSASQTTAVTLNELTATPFDGEALVEWQTGAELTNLGFNVYRSTFADHDFAQINQGLLPGLGNHVTGGRYAFVDQTVTNGTTYYYRLEDVEISGRTTFHGPVSVAPQSGLGPAVLGAGPYVFVETNDGTAGQPTGDPSDPDTSASPGYLAQSLGTRVVSSDATGFDLEIDVPRFTRGSIVSPIDGLTYDTVAIPGYTTTNEVLRPAVFTRMLLVEVPPVVSAALNNLALTSETAGGWSLPAAIPQVPGPGTLLGAIPPEHDGSLAWPPAALRVDGLITVGDRTLLRLEVNPFGYVADTNTLTFHTKLQARVDLGAPVPPSPPPLGADLTQSALASAQGVLTLTVPGDGLFRVTGADLAGAGFDVTGDPRNLWLYNQGLSVPLHAVGESDGTLDPTDTFEFFGRGNQTTYVDSPQSRYSDTNTYWLAYSTTPGPRVPTLNGAPTAGVVPVNATTATTRYEEQNWPHQQPFSPGGLDHWFSDFALAGTGLAVRNYTLTLPHVAAPGAGTLRYRLRGLNSDETTFPDHRAQIQVNGQLVVDTTFDGYAQLAGTVPLTQLLPSGDSTITLTAAGPGADGIFVDFFALDYPRRLIASDRTQMRFAIDAATTQRVENLSATGPADVDVWDLTDPLQPRRLTNLLVEPTNAAFLPDGSIAADPNAYQVTFDTSHDGFAPATKRDLLVLTSSAKQTPTLQLHTPTQALRLDPSHGADFLVITTRALGPAATRLAAYRQGRGLRSQVVYVDEIMDEFAFGNLDPEATQRFLAYAFDSWAQPRPKYVVLLGDGHFDYHDHYGFGGANPVPPIMVETEFTWTASDNRFATVAGADLVPDLRIGRVPVTTLAAADAFVTKLMAYEAAPFDPSWIERHLFVADDIDI